MAFDQLEPIGETRGDIRAALVSSLIANAHRDHKQRSQPYGIEDFMLFQEKQERADPDIAQSVAKLFGMERNGNAS